MNKCLQPLLLSKLFLLQAMSTLVQQNILARKQARLRQDSPIRLEKRCAPMQPADFPSRFECIGDTFCSNVDPVATLQKTEVNRNILQKDTIFHSRLLVPTMIPFTTPFLELCFEVGRHYNLQTRSLHDKDGRMSMDFSLEGVEKTFHLPKHGEIYILKHS